MKFAYTENSVYGSDLGWKTKFVLTPMGLPEVPSAPEYLESETSPALPAADSPQAEPAFETPAALREGEEAPAPALPETEPAAPEVEHPLDTPAAPVVGESTPEPALPETEPAAPVWSPTSRRLPLHPKAEPNQRQR